MHDFQFETRYTAREFAKVKQHDSFLEKGLVFDAKTNTFSDWQFTGTKENAAGNITLSGEGIGDGKNTPKSLLQILYDTDSGDDIIKKLRIVKQVCAAIESALTQGIDLPLVGAGGTFIDFADSESLSISKILFLPEKFYSLVLNSFSKERQSELLYFWHIHVIKERPESLRFACNAYVYAAICGFPPFFTNEDYIDSYYLPLPWANLAEIEQEIGQGEAEFLQKCENFRKERILFFDETKKKIEKKRFLRKNRKEIIIGICALVVLGGVILSVHIDKLSDRTTLGLTGEQTIEIFYSAVNMLDPGMMQAAGYRLKNNELENAVIAMYATSKMREAYQENKIMNPADWDKYGLTDKAAGGAIDELRGKFFLFGISDFTINGKNAQSYAEAPIKKESAQIQDGSKNGDIAFFTCRYRLLYFTGESEQIEETLWEDDVEVTFVKDRWRITAIKHKEQ